jgi:hypothetical protein
MNRTSLFRRCLQSRSKLSPQLNRVLQDDQLLAELTEVAHECHLRENNQSCFILRGKLDVHDADLHSAIRGAVQHVVDDDAANSISEVLRLATNLVLVMCDSKRQCWRITSHRRAFSSIDNCAHSSETVQRVLRTKLYVDNYCTKEQLGIRDSLWPVLRELKAAGMRPYFEGELLYYYPTGSKRATVHTAKPSAEEQHAAREQPPVLQRVGQDVQQQEQPRAEQAAAQQAVEQQSVEQPSPHHGQPEQQPTTSAPSLAPQVLADAAAASAVTAPAPEVAVSHQEPRQKKTRHEENQPVTQRNIRPPFRTISNTAPRFGTGPTSNPGKRPVQHQPEWGAGARPRSMRSGGIPMFLPNGQIGYVL